MKIKRWMLGLGISIVAASGSLVACTQRDAIPAPPRSASASATVPPPPGDSTPTPVDSDKRAAAQGNEKTGASGPQSTVGTAAAGAPPYTLNSAPEGNQAPSQGTKAAEEPAKK